MQVSINGQGFDVPEAVAKYIADIERDIRNAQTDAQTALGKARDFEQQVRQAVADGEAKVRAAETKLMGWVEARAHSFFLTVDGDFRNVAAFLKHLTGGLEAHLQPKTLTSAPSAGAVGVHMSTAPAPAAPAPAAEAAAPSAPAQGS